MGLFQPESVSFNIIMCDIILREVKRVKKKPVKKRLNEQPLEAEKKESPGILGFGCLGLLIIFFLCGSYCGTARILEYFSINNFIAQILITGLLFILCSFFIIYGALKGRCMGGDSIMCIGFILILTIIFLPNFLISRQQGKLATCESNLKNIATALEMYAADYKEHYPPSLDYLTREIDNGPYIKELPKCPASNSLYTYEYCISPDNFTLWCGKAGFHFRVGEVSEEGNWPQYTPAKGIMYKP